MGWAFLSGRPGRPFCPPSSPAQRQVAAMGDVAAICSVYQKKKDVVPSPSIILGLMMLGEGTTSGTPGCWEKVRRQGVRASLRGSPTLKTKAPRRLFFGISFLINFLRVSRLLNFMAVTGRRLGPPVMEYGPY
jgi:hypothetical protein